MGSPVEGPPRCTSTITSGSSAMLARPIISVLRESPGPLVAVMDFLPAKEAPDGRADAGDLVLGLEHRAAVLPDPGR